MRNWGYAQFSRGEYERGRNTVEDGARDLTLDTVDAVITRGDILRRMGVFDARQAIGWFMLAGAEYERIPHDDVRRRWYLGYLLDDMVAGAEKRVAAAGAVPEAAPAAAPDNAAT